MRPYEVVRVLCLRVVGAAWSRPPAAADVKPAPCRLCPIHLRPQCEQCRLPWWGVAHCYVRGHKGHLLAVAGAASSIKGFCRRGWRPWSRHRDPSQAPLRGAGSGGGGRVHSALGGETPPPPGSSGCLGRGGGARCGRRASVAWGCWGWEGSWTAPPHSHWRRRLRLRRCRRCRRTSGTRVPFAKFFPCYCAP